MEIKTREKLRDQKGITIVALVVTIVVLLILSMVTIREINGEGIVEESKRVKIEQIVSNVKEKIRVVSLENKLKGGSNSVEQLYKDGKVSRTVQSSDGETYYMHYILKSDAYTEMSGLGGGNYEELTDVFFIDDNFNIKYIDKDGKEYGDNIEEKILQDETEVKFANEAFSAYISKISGIEENEMKFKWMKTQTSLSITDQTITSLEDLVFFPNLTWLGIGTWQKGLKLEDLSGIENCTKLTSVETFASTIERLDGIEKLKKLTTFGAYQGNVKNFSKISEINNLKTLAITQKCSVEEIVGYLENKTALTSIRLENCNDNMVSTSCFSKLKGDLTSIIIKNAGIQKIEGLEKFKNLKTINLDSNNIINITPLAANTKLTSISLMNNPNLEANRANYSEEEIEKLNQIGKILENGGSIMLSLPKLGLFTGYKTLNLNGQGLTDLECLRGQTELTSLDLTSNPKLTFEDEASLEIIKSMKKLKTLTLRYDAPASIEFVNELDSLTTLNINNLNSKHGVNLKQIEDKISNLYIYLDPSVFNTIVDCDSDKITKIDIRLTSTPNQLPDLSKFTKLTSIRGFSSASDISIITKITSLERWYASNANLHGRLFDLSNLTNLIYLDLSSNYLFSDDLIYVRTLKNNKNMTIDLRKNSIVDASYLLELDPSTKIYISGNVNLTQESKNALKERFGSNVVL